MKRCRHRWLQGSTGCGGILCFRAMEIQDLDEIPTCSRSLKQLHADSQRIATSCSLVRRSRVCRLRWSTMMFFCLHDVPPCRCLKRARSLQDTGAVSIPIADRQPLTHLRSRTEGGKKFCPTSRCRDVAAIDQRRRWRE